jgi:hypothetical protein
MDTIVSKCINVRD